MGKVLKTVLIIAVVIVLTYLVQPQLAAMLASAGLSATMATIAAAVVVAVVAAAASALIMGKPKQANQSMFDRLNITVVPTAPRKICFGQTAGGADERFHEKTKRQGALPKGDYYWRVIALASHKVHAVTAVYLEDELSFNGSSTVGKYATKAGLSIQVVNEGSSSNAASYGSGSYWTSSAKFTGCAYLKMRQKLDEEIYPNGLPQRFTAVVKGCPVYDPRLDSTNGGSGSHRPNDQTTWSWVNGTDEIGRNSALCLLTYLIGWKINGKVAWGMGIPAERIDLANFIQYANMCDESVTTKAGGTVKRYQCDCILSTADSHETNITTITATMGTTRLVDTCGFYQLVGGFDDLDGPTLDFNEDDFLAQYEWRPSVPARERYNIARGRFANPTKLYQVEDWGEVSIDPLADGIPRPMVLELAGVTRSESCQRIARQHLVRNAYTGLLSSTFGPKAFGVQLGSLVRVSLQKEGWNNKLFRVIDQSEATDLIFQMTLQEENANIYAWDESEAVDLPADVRPPAYDPAEIEAVADLAATTRTITNSTGGTDSYIDVSWTAPEGAIAAIYFQTRETGGTKWQDVGFADEEAEVHTFRSVSSGIGHEVRARYRMLSGFWAEWSDPVEITAAVATGVNAISGYLTDESVTFAADADGVIL